MKANILSLIEQIKNNQEANQSEFNDGQNSVIDLLERLLKTN